MNEEDLTGVKKDAGEDAANKKTSNNPPTNEQTRYKTINFNLCFRMFTFLAATLLYMWHMPSVVCLRRLDIAGFYICASVPTKLTGSAERNSSTHKVAAPAHAHTQGTAARQQQ